MDTRYLYFGQFSTKAARLETLGNVIALSGSGRLLGVMAALSGTGGLFLLGGMVSKSREEHVSGKTNPLSHTSRESLISSDPGPEVQACVIIVQHNDTLAEIHFTVSKVLTAVHCRLKVLAFGGN